jgi:hypothetical protein
VTKLRSVSMFSGSPLGRTWICVLFGVQFLHAETHVAIPPEVQKQAVAGSGIPNCNGCERDLAEKTGAEWEAWGTVQKVSNPILNIICTWRTCKPAVSNLPTA